MQVRATSADEALAIRKELRDQVDAALLAAIERAFDAAAPPGEIVHIRRLDVRARISGVGEVGGELARHIEQELRRQLAARHPAATQGDEAAARDAAAGPANGARADAGPEGWRGAAALAQQPAAEPRARLQLLLHYLETGALPWPLANVASADVRAALQEAAGAERAGVLDHLAGAPASLHARVAFWFRWLQLLPDESWPAVARAAAAGAGAGSARIAEIVAALVGAPAGSIPRYARLQLGAAAIAVAVQEGALVDAPALAAIVLDALGGAGDARTGASPGVDAEASDALSGGAAGHTRSTGRRDGSEERTDEGAASIAEGARVQAARRLAAPLPEPAAAAFRGWLAAPGSAQDASAPQPAADARDPDARDGRERGSAGRAATSPPAAEDAPRADRSAVPSALPARGEQPGARAGAMPGPSRPPEPRPDPALAAALRDARAAADAGASLRAMPFGQMVRHAGLVLVHPFLPRFFESTGVKQAGRPALSAAELPRAAALLHLLATGDEEAIELELDFAKILLGLPPGAQLPVAAGLLRASDREEVEALLAAIIEHWRALKSTSVQGLRASFLQRGGLLREEDQGFRLQIEPAPYDMLLGQLPWGIGTIKLPWMRKALFTDWPAP